MAIVSRLGSIAIDCADPKALADFYSSLTGWPIAFIADDFVVLSGPGFWLATSRVDDYRAPDWPTGELRKQLHLDFAVEDLDAAETAAIALGATKPGTQPSPDKWRVLLDPSGHPFCLNSQLPST